MHALLEGAIGVFLIVAALVATIVVTGLPHGIGLFFRLVLVGLWFWWRGWEALLGLVILDLIGGGMILYGPICEFLEDLEQRKRRAPPHE